MRPNSLDAGCHGRMGTLWLRGAEGLIWPKFYTRFFFFLLCPNFPHCLPEIGRAVPPPRPLSRTPIQVVQCIKATEVAISFLYNCLSSRLLWMHVNFQSTTDDRLSFLLSVCWGVVCGAWYLFTGMSNRCCRWRSSQHISSQTVKPA